MIWLLLLVMLPGRRRRRALWQAAFGLGLLGLLGCDDGGDQIRLTADFESIDFQVIDRGRSDAGTGCRPSPEVCDTIDNDCDGLIDGDDPDLLTQLLVDPDNCGRCDAICQAPNARFACQAGECVIVECAPGFGDYNANIADGCEADCVITAGGVEICDAIDNDCDGRLDEGFDLQSDPTHCGDCGVICADVPAARVACVDSGCVFECERGFVDLDGDAANGCEYACDARAGEICNGLDDDCDGAIDEADGLAPPEIGCGDEGVCAAECGSDGDCGGDVCVAGVCAPVEVPALDCARDADCQAEHPGLACVGGRCAVRSRQPVCDGAAGYRCARPVTWRGGDEVGLCDGADNDCDGRVDEDFVAELFEADRATPRPCFVGLGLCQREGISVCSPDGSAVICSARPGPPDDPNDDDCDGIDDDCDGVLDEGHLDAWIAIGAFEIYAYEASRPGATPFVAGRDVRADDDAQVFVEGRACSRPGVLPWAEVTWPQAQAACALAGGRLCTDAEWSLACGGMNAAAYPYGAQFDADACNGGGYDVDPDTDGVQDGLLHTGRLERCDRGGVLDLSGNLKEWTAQAQDGLRVVRGGGYESNVPAGLMCNQRSDLKAEGFRHPGIGFRCCR